MLLFGGTFDPPHIGHAALLRAAAQRIRPERILIIPAFQAPLKGAAGAAAADRCRLAEAGLLSELPKRWRRLARIDISELESRRVVYTVETLQRLKKTSDELHFVVGSDSAASWNRWKEPSALKAGCRWWTAARPGAWGPIPAHFGRLRARMPAISSTELRQALAEGRDVSPWLAPGVLAYIEKKGLYGQGRLQDLSAWLKPRRYQHCLNVARLASALARRWDADEDRARLAGLVHDCGRGLKSDKMPRYTLARRLSVPARGATILHNPLLLHAYISADLAERRFGVKDPAVLSAVRKHTLGAARMSLLDRVVYVADAVCEDRDYPEAGMLRRLAFRDLDKAFFACVSNKLAHALGSGSWLHPLTVKVWNTLARK